MNDEITEQIDKLSELDDSGIASLEGDILSAFSDIETEDPTPQSVDEMTSLADALDAVRTELTRRSEQALELKRKSAELTDRVGPTELSEDDEDTEDVAEDKAEDIEAADEELSKKDDEDEEVDVIVEEGPGDEVDVDIIAEDESGDEIDVVVEEEPGEEVDVVVEDETGAPEAEVDITDVEGTPEVEVEVDEDLLEEEERKKKYSNSDEDETTAVEASDEQTNSTDKENPMTASTTPTEGEMVAPAEAAPVARKQDELGIGLTITAGADIPNVGAGSKFSGMDDLATAFANRLHTLRNASGGNGEQHTVATFNFEYPEAYSLSGDDASNLAKVNGVEALVAAAGICAPLEPLYDMGACGVTDRPVRDALTRFHADRGGVRIYGAPTLDCPGGIWDPAHPADKTCCDAACPTPTEVQIEAVYACMNFSNFTSRFFPEVVKANTELALVQHARLTEQNLLKKINALSTKVTFDAKATTGGGKGVGITRSVLLAVREAVTGMRRRQRMGPRARMRVILPEWVLDAMIADLALQMPGDGLETLSLAARQINKFFTDGNISVTWALDEVTKVGAPVVPAAQAAGVLQPFPTEINFPVFSDKTFLFLDGGTLDLGTVRTGDSLKANEYSTFVESFESVAKVGCEALWVTATNVCASGAAAALVDTSCS